MRHGFCAPAPGFRTCRSRSSSGRRGCCSDTETLHRVNTAGARAVLALSEDDSYNAFVVLAVKELNPNVRTVAAVSNTRNTGRVARTRPDVLLTLPQLGSELLAMALSGEEIKADALISQLLKLG
ncbi:MAG TPA: NAD-binding protein [Steroidobacteraceae bacterium]|nr:NAD-binding protein [Steroidobacteraceae bacterium]